MEEALTAQNLRSQINDRIISHRPVLKEITTPDGKTVVCRLEGMVGGRSFEVYGIAETDEMALIKAKNKLFAQTFHRGYPLPNDHIFGIAAYKQQNMAYDRAYRACVSQLIVEQSMRGAGIPLQIPLQENGFVWENNSKYQFSNHCLSICDGPINLALVIALAIPKVQGLNTLSGVGYATSIEDSTKKAWSDIHEKNICDKLFGLHQNEFPLLNRIESMSADMLKAWLVRTGTATKTPIVLNVEELNKEILFADQDISIIRVSQVPT